MTSASERADDDVIVMTDDNDLTDQSRGAHAAPGPADPELGGQERPGYGDPDDEPAGDPAAQTRDAWGQDSSAPDTSYAGPGGAASADDATTASDEASDSADPAAADRPGTAAAAVDPADQPDFGAADSSQLDPEGPGSGQLGSDELGSGPLGSSPAGSSPADSGTAGTGQLASDGLGTEPGSGSVAQLGTGPGSQPAAGASVPAGGTLRPEENWPEIQAMFVDDPRSAVERAAEVTSGALNALVTAARERELSLRQNWQADGTGTEELRTSLQHYRELAGRLGQLSGEL